MLSILFVCVANTCRSPCLAAILFSLCVKNQCQDKVFIDSCGIMAHCGGKEADARMKQAALKYHLTIEHTSKPFDQVFFEVFDLILAVDENVKEYLLSICPHRFKDKIHLVTSHSKNYLLQSMPDPYERGSFEYERTFTMACDCCEGILKKIKEIF